MGLICVAGFSDWDGEVNNKRIHYTLPCNIKIFWVNSHSSLESFLELERKFIGVVFFAIESKREFNFVCKSLEREIAGSLVCVGGAGSFNCSRYKSYNRILFGIQCVNFFG